MSLTVDSLVDIKNIITGSNKITPRKVNVKPYRCDTMYMDKDLIVDKLYHLINSFHKRKINHRDFRFALLGNMHQFYDRNERTCKILFIGHFS